MNRQILRWVPAQYTGEEIEVQSTLQLYNSIEAKDFYESVKNRLLNVNEWHYIAGILSAKFNIVDAKGFATDRPVQKGDFLKIDIPGPGSSEGGGYDWVCVENKIDIEEGQLSVTGFTVRPSFNPCGDKNTIAHFYSSASTSSFIVVRFDAEIKAMIFDRNLKPNDIANSITDRLRDTAVGLSAILSFSRVQWQNLANGLLKQP